MKIEDLFNLISDIIKDSERVVINKKIKCIYVGYPSADIYILYDSRNIYVQKEEYLEKARELQSRLNKRARKKWNIREEFIEKYE